MPYLFGSCPRCRGDLSLEKDTYSNYWKCVQCGQDYYSPDTVVAPRKTAGERLPVNGYRLPKRGRDEA